MTDTFANYFSAGSLFAALVSTGIALAAYKKSAAADLRDREAIIIVSQVWERMGDDDAYYGLAGNVPQHDRPVLPDLRFAITPPPGKPVNDGLTLRRAPEQEDPDRHQWLSHHRLMKIENAGRAAATDLNLQVDLEAGFFVRSLEHDVETRSFSNTLNVGGIPAGSHRYVEIRNLVGKAVKLHFCSATCGHDQKQPTRLDAHDIFFNGRGPWAVRVTNATSEARE